MVLSGFGSRYIPPRGSKILSSRVNPGYLRWSSGDDFRLSSRPHGTSAGGNYHVNLQDTTHVLTTLQTGVRFPVGEHNPR